ncbi:MAG: hypothetical protein Q4Q18_06230 [Methanobrevibacter sp.]|nr:hypothetical protein [Methanobrevibacter sp.]
MKFKKIMLITFLLLAVLTIGAVSASDDVSDENLTVSDGGDDAIVPDDDLVSSCDVDDEIGDDQRENISTYIHVPESVRAGELDEYDVEDNFVVTCDFYWVGDEPTGNFSVLIDDKQVYTDLVSDHYYYNYNPCFELNKLNLGFGNHTVQVKYGGDDNYLPFTETRTYELYYMKEIVPNPVLIGNWNQQQLIIDFTLNATGSLKVLVDNKSVKTYER